MGLVYLPTFTPKTTHMKVNRPNIEHPGYGWLGFACSVVGGKKVQTDSPPGGEKWWFMPMVESVSKKNKRKQAKDIKDKGYDWWPRKKPSNQLRHGKRTLRKWPGKKLGYVSYEPWHAPKKQKSLGGITWIIIFWINDDETTSPI